ncbi:Cyclopropane-fatty-acyl-phospholipid/mycolic acid synthase [Niveomyces insectorum RCEF 264]|uniref:Cyclopropane-fatty-acyl-phospholipid/mycolic acid synthase n=1 Tax=Niveomyces insectorum RCEF 264 TaxID=1081102 RepID=A0A167RY42_9HYPO|nr:Cyclopropane-fatty-acyl-phospholipid/mycolic acid synthase [Niveomyces insectorum RCEF 264]
MATSTADPAAVPPVDETTNLSRQYDTPLGLAHTTMQALKERIKQHYDLASDYYVSLWGEHIHHGYWPTDASKAHDSKETAQANLIQLLLSISGLGGAGEDARGDTPLTVLDVGCGVGGTSRYLASRLGCRVTGITISTRQVELATKLTAQAAAAAVAAAGTPDTSTASADAHGFLPLGHGRRGPQPLPRQGALLPQRAPRAAARRPARAGGLVQGRRRGRGRLCARHPAYRGRHAAAAAVHAGRLRRPGDGRGPARAGAAHGHQRRRQADVGPVVGARAEPGAVGVCPEPGPRRHRVSAGVPGDAPRVRQRHVPVRGHVF